MSNLRVRFRPRDDKVLVADCKNQKVIEYTRDQWRALLDQVREDEWVDDAWHGCDTWLGWDTDDIWWRGDNADLYFTRAEIDAFIADATAGKFNLKERNPS